MDTTTTVRHSQVDKNGRIEIAGPASITIGSVLTGAIDAVIRTGNYAHMFIKRTLIRELTIDSTNETTSLMDMLLAKKRAKDRKSWLEKKGDLADI